MGWVHLSFRKILLDHCDEYIDSSDRGSDKTQSKLITRVSKEITEISEAAVEVIPLPSDVEKVTNLSIIVLDNTDVCLQCVRVWFGNYASGNAKEDRPAKSKLDI